MIHESRRVVVTGMGTVGPVGLKVATAWNNVIAGRSGVRRITLFDASDLRVKIAGEAWGFDPLDFMSAKEARRADRNVQFAVAAALEALEQASLPSTSTAGEETGVVIGSGAGGIWTYTAQQAVLDTHGPQRLSPLLIPMITVDSASVQVSILAGAKGPCLGLASTCSTGADAIGEAFEIIRRGDAQVMIAGGTEAAVTRLGIAGFDQLGALSRRNHEPATAARPFDASRDGFVLSEGAGILIVEEMDHALNRGAEPLAEIRAYAATADGRHLTHPDQAAAQAGRAITRALVKGGLRPEEIGYVNAHGTGTKQGDPFEVRALRRALGDDFPRRVPVSSTKSVTGHLLGAAGAVEAIWCVMALRDGAIPPTINYQLPDPKCDLDCVPNVARRVEKHDGQGSDRWVTLSTSFGFGGHNSALILGRAPAR